MRWISHSATTFCITLAVTNNPILSAASAVMSAAPDQIEVFLPFTRHRGISHDVIFWVPLLLVIAALPHMPFSAALSDIPIIYHIMQIGIIGLVVGVLSHLIFDGLSNTGIPILSKYRFAAKWYKTFTSSEYLLTLGVCVVFLSVYGLLNKLIPETYQIWTLLK